MEPYLFDIKDGVVIPSEHCYTIAAYKNVIDEFGENSGKIFAFFHYMCSLNEKTNPFALIPEAEKEEIVTRQICPELDTEHAVVREALELTKKCYETTAFLLYQGFKVNQEKLAMLLRTAEWSTGKEGNMTQLLSASKAYPALREAYKQAYREYQEEQGNNQARGGADLAYDENDDDDLDL